MIDGCQSKPSCSPARRRTETGAPVAAASRVYTLPRIDVRDRCAGYVLSPLLHQALRGALPRETPLTAVRLGELRVLASPFELGVEVAEELRARSPGPLLVAAHADGWLGHLLMPEDYARGGSEACLAFHGPRAAVPFVDAAARLLWALE